VAQNSINAGGQREQLVAKWFCATKSMKVEQSTSSPSCKVKQAWKVSAGQI
jgi:hypothetical protein